MKKPNCLSDADVPFLLAGKFNKVQECIDACNELMDIIAPARHMIPSDMIDRSGLCGHEVLDLMKKNQHVPEFAKGVAYTEQALADIYDGETDAGLPLVH